MKLTFSTDKAVTIENAFSIESETANYFDALLISNNGTEQLLLSDITPIGIHVDVADSIVIGTTATVTAAVTLLYESPESAGPLEMAAILLQALEQDVESSRSFTFSSDSSSIVFAFLTMQNASKVLQVRTSGMTTTEVGLIVVTAFLSVMLVIVSSVLLYITGGWKVCTTKLSNCLFEEVDDDEYIVTQKSTYPIQESTDDDDEEESNITSLPPSSASGILGVARNRDHRGLGMLSPGTDDDDESSMTYGDSYNLNPLGIVSMRKLPQPDDSPQGSYSGIVKQRLLLRSANRNK